MGFNITKMITRAVGLPDKAIPIVNAVFPALLATNVAGTAILKVASGIVGGGKSQSQAAAPVPQQAVAPVPTQTQTTVPYYVQGGGSYLAPDYAMPYQQPYYGYEGGYNPWGYSTSPMISFPQTYYQPVSTYSPAPAQQGGIWEDIAQAAPLLLGFL